MAEEAGEVESLEGMEVYVVEEHWWRTVAEVEAAVKVALSSMGVKLERNKNRDTNAWMEGDLLALVCRYQSCLQHRPGAWQEGAQLALRSPRLNHLSIPVTRMVPATHSVSLTFIFVTLVFRLTVHLTRQQGYRPMSIPN